LKNYYELTKPRITWLILVTTGVGYYFGQQGVLDWLTLFHCMVGTALIASGTSALNQWYEHQSDALMRNGRFRPGRLRRATRCCLASCCRAWATFSSRWAATG
jgi:protoheme IX farnesyltransferase